MQKKRHDLLRDHDQMGSMTVTGERKIEKRLGSPIGIPLSVSEILCLL
jgi:hypothetical protein